MGVKDVGMWRWVLDMSGAVGRTVRVETRDGVYRNGVFEALVTREVDMFGRKTGIPIAVRISGDEIPIDRVAKIEKL